MGAEHKAPRSPRNTVYNRHAYPSPRPGRNRRLQEDAGVPEVPRRRCRGAGRAVRVDPSVRAVRRACGVRRGAEGRRSDPRVREGDGHTHRVDEHQGVRDLVGGDFGPGRGPRDRLRNRPRVRGGRARHAPHGGRKPRPRRADLRRSAGCVRWRPLRDHVRLPRAAGLVPVRESGLPAERTIRSSRSRGSAAAVRALRESASSPRRRTRRSSSPRIRRRPTSASSPRA